MPSKNKIKNHFTFNNLFNYIMSFIREIFFPDISERWNWRVKNTFHKTESEFGLKKSVMFYLINFSVFSRICM